MNYSFDIKNSIDALQVDSSMKTRVLDVENAQFKVKQREARIKRKRTEKMILSLLIVCVTLFVATNTTTYAMTGKSLWSLFFSEKEQVTYEPLINEADYGFEIDGYTFKIIEALYEKNTQSGCWIVSITKDGKAPEITLDEAKHMTSLGFGENNRFEIIPYYRDNIEYEIVDGVLYACLIYHGNLEDFTTFEVVDYSGPWKGAFDTAKPFVENASINKSDENRDTDGASKERDGMAIGDYKVYNLGKNKVSLVESGGWNRESDKYIDGLGITINVDMGGGYYCLKGSDELGTKVYVSPFGFMIYSDTECYYNDKVLNMKGDDQMGLQVEYSFIENVEGPDGVTVRNQYVCGGTYSTRLDIDNIKSITIAGKTIELSKVVNEKKEDTQETNYNNFSEEPITQEQMNQITNWMNEDSQYGFLCSSYKDVALADFDLIFMNGAGLKYTEVSKDELLQYSMDICEKPIKLSYDSVETFIDNNIGRSWMEFKNGRYLNCVDQVNSGYFYIDNRSVEHGKFECVSGTKKGDLITITVKCSDYTSKLLVREFNGSYRVISNIISDENAEIIEKDEQRWGMTGHTKTKEQKGVILERDEKWLKDGNEVYTKHIKHGDVTSCWTVYRDNIEVYQLEAYSDGSTSGVPVGEYAPSMVLPNSSITVKLEQADVTGITDIANADINFKLIGEETLNVDCYWETAWSCENYTNDEDIINSNLLNIYGKKAGEQALFQKKMKDGKVIITRCTILKVE